MVDEDACKQALVLGNGSDGKFSMGTICDLPTKEEVKLHILFPMDSEKMGEESDLGRSSSRNTDQDEKDCDHASKEVWGEERCHAKNKLRLTTEQATLLQNTFEEHILFPMDSEKMGEESDLGRSSSRNTDQDEKDCDHASKEVWGEERRHAKKKLRLTTEQATLLQNSFEEHRTLNFVQKQELADQLNLQPRQVEVWFQNRRARTKLKRKEMDCEYLKKYCQSLRVENQRLKEELMALRTMKQHGLHLSRSIDFNGFQKTPAICVCPARKPLPPTLGETTPAPSQRLPR